MSKSTSQRASFEDSEKRNSDDGSFVKLKGKDDIEMGSEVERAELLGNATTAAAQEKQPEATGSSAKAAIVWMIVNTLATIGIVCPDFHFHKQHKGLTIPGLHQQGYF